MKAKRELTSLDLSAIVRELTSRVVGLYVDNVYQLNDGSILLKLRGRGESLSLIADAVGRLSLTWMDFERPPRPPAFCALVRSRVRGGRVAGVRQLGDDRIVELEVDSRGERYRLIFEFVRGFNAVLVGPDGTILGCLHPKRMRDRALVPKEPYRPPPSRGVSLLSVGVEEFLRALRGAGGKLASALVRGLNVAGEVAEELCARAGLDRELKVDVLGEDEARRLHEEARRLKLEVSEGPLTPHIVLVDGEPVTVLPIPFKSVSGERREYPSFNEAVDAYFAKVRAEREAAAKEEALERRAEQLEEVAEKQRARLEELRREAEEKRRAAEELMKALPAVDEALRRLRGVVKAEGGEAARRLVEEGGVRPIVEVDLASRRAIAVVGGVRVELAIDQSAAQSASRLYEEAKEAERKASSVERALKATLEELERVRAGIVEVEEERREVEEPRPKPWYHRFRWFISSDGVLVVAGRDASQNEVLVRRYMEPNDVFVHADVHGAPAVIVKGCGPKPPERTIVEAAQFAVSYSRAWREGRLMADAYWVLPHQVSKTPPSGQYLARGAFMVRGERNYVRGVPLQVAIGVDESGELIAGPPDPITSRAKRYVILAPGEVGGSRLAHEVAKALGLEPRRVDEVQRAIPPGGGRILKVKA